MYNIKMKVYRRTFQAKGELAQKSHEVIQIIDLFGSGIENPSGVQNDFFPKSGKR